MMKDDKKSVITPDIAELNKYIEHKANFSIEPEVSKPFDIYLMTGNDSSNSNKGSDKKQTTY